MDLSMPAMQKELENTIPHPPPQQPDCLLNSIWIEILDPHMMLYDESKIAGALWNWRTWLILLRVGWSAGGENLEDWTDKVHWAWV